MVVFITRRVPGDTQSGHRTRRTVARAPSLCGRTPLPQQSFTSEGGRGPPTGAELFREARLPSPQNTNITRNGEANGCRPVASLTHSPALCRRRSPQDRPSGPNGPPCDPEQWGAQWERGCTRMEGGGRTHLPLKGALGEGSRLPLLFDLGLAHHLAEVVWSKPKQARCSATPHHPPLWVPKNHC